MSKKTNNVFENIKTWVEDVIDFPYDDYANIMEKIGLFSTDTSHRETQRFAHELLHGDHQDAEANANLKTSLEALRDEFFPIEIEAVDVPEDTEAIETDTDTPENEPGTVEIDTPELAETDTPMPTGVTKEFDVGHQETETTE